MLEEIGCRAEVVAEVGEIVEYRDEWDMKQTSYCYQDTPEEYGGKFIRERDLTFLETAHAISGLV